MSRYIRAYLIKYHPHDVVLMLNDNDLSDQQASILLEAFYAHPEDNFRGVISLSSVDAAMADSCADIFL